jgi:hypothetical protein
MTETLVAHATTYDNAVQAIFQMVKDRPYVGSLDIEAIPILAYALVLGNRKGLSLDDMRRILASRDQVLLELIAPAVESTDEQEQLAALLFKRWLDEPILAERAHKTLVLVSAHALLFEQRSSL